MANTGDSAHPFDSDRVEPGRARHHWLCHRRWIGARANGLTDPLGVPTAGAGVDVRSPEPGQPLLVSLDRGPGWV